MINPSPTPPSSLTKIAAFIIAGLALVASVLWAVDNYVGRDKSKIVLAIILVFVAVLLVGWLLFWVIRKIVSLFSSRRARKEEEQAAVPQLGATAEEQADLDILQARLDTAVKVMRQSKLAKGKKPDEALYMLPWILFMGPPGCGKTTTLRESGVDFPYSTAEDRRYARERDAGCEFWFSRGGVILDLAGRLGAADEGADVFKGFLDQLKRARRVRPVDAVVVAISIPEIIQGTPDQVERLANRIRQRFDEMIRRLGIRFPIYVLFTKFDEVPGFTEFFSNLRSQERGQVWGATIPRSQRKRNSPELIFQREFDRLREALSAYRLQLMANERDKSRHPHVYNFPAGFASLRERLTAFVGTLLQPTPYSERPLFRGFYFGSAGGASPERAHGRPDDMQPQAWDPGHRLAAAEEKTGDSRNYFLESLFPRLIFADRPLATENVDMRLRRRLWLDVALISTLLVCAVLLTGMSFSFFENRSLIQSTRTAALPLVDAGWNAKRFTDLTALEQLRQRVEELDRFSSEGPRLLMRWGLYSGGGIEKSARHVYFQRLRESFVTPASNALRQRLYAIATGSDASASYDDFYTTLKAYMMMADPERSEASFLNNALEPIWKKAGPPEAESVSLKQLRFYAEQLPRKDPELMLTIDNDVVARARRALCQYPALTRVYTRLKNEGNTKLQPFSIRQATGGKSLEFLTSSHDVPGVFTEAGWSGFFKAAVERASAEVSKDDWVMGSTCTFAGTGEVTDTEYRQKLLDMYFVEYTTEWSRFLEGVSVRPLRDLTEARASLDSFSQQDSALSRLLMNVAANTMLRREPEKGSSITAMVSSALATVGLGTRVNRAELVEVVEAQFRPLHDIVTSPDGKEPSLVAKYIQVLAKVHTRLEGLFGGGAPWDQVKAYVGNIANNISGDEFREGYAVIARIRQECRTRSTGPIDALLEQPLRQSWTAILNDVGLRLDGLWSSRVAEGFKRDVESRFPFNPSGPDIPLSLLSQYFRPSDGILWDFQKKELEMFLTQAESRFIPREIFSSRVDFSPSFLEFLSRAYAMRLAFYGAGSLDPNVTFDLTPAPESGTRDVTESLLVIDSNRLVYRNERPAPRSYSWPGKGAPQAGIQISIAGSGERPNLGNLDGEWAFFRLLQRARTVPLSPTTYTVIWSLNSSDGRKFDVSYRLQSRSVSNPFLPEFFTIRCPDHLIRGGGVSLTQGLGSGR